MGYKSAVVASIFLAATAYASEPKAYQSGTVVEMASVQCRVNEKDGKSLGSKEPLADADRKTTQGPLCQEYVLQAEKVIYRLRPKNTKHLLLLPVGERAQFRIEKGKLLVRAEVAGSRELEYRVISMTPLGDSTADARPAHVNHLQ